MLLVSFLLVICVSLLLGIWAGKGQKFTASSFFIDDRSLNKWAIGISASATANTGFVVIGAVGMGYTMGISAALYSIAWLLGDIVYWHFFSRKVNTLSQKNEAITILDLFKEKTSSYLSLVVSGIVVLMLTVYASAQFNASGKTLGNFYDLGVDQGMIITLLLVLAYTIWGGFKSSILTDLFQGILMVFLTIGVLLWCLIEVNGLSGLFNSLKMLNPELTNFISGFNLLTLTVFVLGFAFAGFGFSMSQPQVISRVMAGKDDKHTKDSKWIYMIFLHSTWIGMVLIGMCCRLLLPELEATDPELALPTIAAKFHPFITGLILGGMFSAIASSLDSMIMAISTTISVDILGLNREKDSKTLFRLILISVGVLALLLASFVTESVFSLSLMSAKILTATVGACVTIVVLRLKATPKSLSVGISIGLLCTLCWRYFDLHEIVSEALIGFAITLLSNWIVAFGQDIENNNEEGGKEIR